MPRRRPNQPSTTNPEAKKYQDLYLKAGSNPDNFVNIFIDEFIKKNIEFSAISQEINAIEKAFGREDGLAIIKSFLNTKYVIDDNFSLTLFKTCLDIVCLPSKRIDQGELIQTLMICKSKLYGSVMNDHKNIPQFKEMMIYFLEKTKALADNKGEDFLNLKYEIFDLLKLPGIDDEVKDAIIKSLNLKSRALTSIIKGDNKDLISKIYERPESFNDLDQLGNGALHYACCIGNVNAIMILQGIAEINSVKNYFGHAPLNLFPSDLKAEKKKLLIFGNDLKDTEPNQKFIHTFKNLSDVGKKQLFSSFLKHKKFPNLDSALTDIELQDFFATFRQDEEAFQKLANLTKDKPENQEFIKLINDSKLFDQGFKDVLKLKSKTLAEKLIDSFKSKDNDDAKKLFLTDILQNTNPEIPSTESSSLKDDDVYNFFKIFLRNNEYEELFDKFRDEDEAFADIRMQKEGLIEPIPDELELEDFINFLNIFSSYDFQKTSEEIKAQIKNFLSSISKEDNILNLKEYILEICDNKYILRHAFSPDNHLALSNLYLNYPEETKEIFTHEKLAILLDSDLQVVQKQKLLIKVLEMDSDESEKLGLIKSALKSTWSKSEIFFLNRESDEVKELLKKLNVQQITEIYFSFKDLANNPDVIFLDDYFFNSNRFNYDQKSVFLDYILANPDLLKRETILEDSDCSIFKHFSITLIKSEFANFVSNYNPKAQENLLSTALNSENISKVEKIDLLTDLLATNDEIKLNLIYDYFLNKNLASAQELLTQEVVGALFASDLDQEKKLNLGRKILSYDGLDEELRANISPFLPAEFLSSLSRDQKTVESEVRINESANFSAQRVGEKSRSSSPDQNPSQDSSSPVEVDSNGSSPSNLGSSETNLSNTSGFSAIRTSGSDNKSPSPIEISSAGSAPSSPVQEISAGSASPVSQGVSTSTSITSATIGMGSPEPQTLSAISIVDNVPSVDDYKDLIILLTGRVSNGFHDVRSYVSTQETCDPKLKRFCIGYQTSGGDDGKNGALPTLKDDFHKEHFEPLFRKIFLRNTKFDESRLKSYLYSILAISCGHQESAPCFLKDYEYLIEGRGDMRINGVGHGSWIKNAQDYVRLKEIIRDMDKIHEESIEQGTIIFTENNLSRWMITQVQDKKIEEVKFLDNKKFVNNLITAFENKNSDAKSLELNEAEEYFKDFLKDNTNFFKNLCSIKDSSEDNENKKLATYLFDKLIEESKSSILASGKSDQIIALELINLDTLKENFAEKISTFNEKLSSDKPWSLDSEEHLILNLILEIPTDVKDILQTKHSQIDSSFRVSKNIKNFSESLGNRESISKFREICEKRAEEYSKEISVMRASPSSLGR